MKIDEKLMHEFKNIIDQRAIYTVFQPIVNLKNGEILGYEALSRINTQKTNLMIADFFKLAEKTGYVWQLEKLCRKKALKAATRKPEVSKIFLNVDGNIIQDPEFIEGFTNKRAAKNGIKASDIVFEITERTDVENYKILQEVIQHYANQGYEIALDDVGAGYSGLNRVVNINPQYLKIDMELIRNINQMMSKKKMVELLCEYSKEMGYQLIAEGIETKEELKTLLDIGVQFGQGYYLGKPDKEFKDISSIAKEIIISRI